MHNYHHNNLFSPSLGIPEIAVPVEGVGTEPGPGLVAIADIGPGIVDIVPVVVLAAVLVVGAVGIVAVVLEECMETTVPVAEVAPGRMGSSALNFEMYGRVLAHYTRAKYALLYHNYSILFYSPASTHIAGPYDSNFYSARLFSLGPLRILDMGTHALYSPYF